MQGLIIKKNQDLPKNKRQVINKQFRNQNSYE